MTTSADALNSLTTAFAGHDRDDVQQVVSGLLASAAYLARHVWLAEVFSDEDKLTLLEAANLLGNLVVRAFEHEAREFTRLDGAKIEGHLASLVAS